MTESRTAALSRQGVSIWLDDLSRTRLTSGNLVELIATHDVVGVTTNPTIFAAAIGSDDGYDEALAAAARRKDEVEDVIFDLMCADVADACDVFAEVYQRTQGRDGRVSIEVSPELAHDADATVAQARDLWQRVARPNAMIKIPATDAGLTAITETIAQGISVNVTLIFSLTRYRSVINAYLTGLERARSAGRDLSSIHSVASFFISRLDTLVDSKLAQAGSDESFNLRSKAGLANARLAYEVYEQMFASERAKLLLSQGANLQRPLWASTGVKDPSLPDTLYVNGLVAPNVVNTMPESTLQAFADHGEAPTDTITNEFRESDLILNALDGQNIDYQQVTAQLEAEAVQKFEASWRELHETVRRALEAKH